MINGSKYASKSSGYLKSTEVTASEEPVRSNPYSALCAMAGKEAGRALGASNMLIGGLPIAVTGGAEPGAVGGVTVPEIAEIGVVCLSLLPQEAREATTNPRRRFLMITSATLKATAVPRAVSRAA